MSPQLALNAAKPQAERRCLHCVCTHDGRVKISESFVVCISWRTIATFINGRERKTKDRLELCAQPSAPRKRNLAALLCVCELFLNRDLSQTVINHRATHKLHHLQPREPISGLLTLSSHDECRAPSNIFSFSDEIDQSSNPEKSLKAGRQAGLTGWRSSSRLRPAIHQALAATTKREEPREAPFSFFPFPFSPTRRGWVNRDYESRREQSGQRDKSYLASGLNLSSC